MKPSNPSVRGLLDAVVSADPDYSWRVNEGVVNLTPRYVKLQFLDTKVSKLDLKLKTPDESLNALLILPEVQNQAKKELGSRVVQGSPYAFSTNGEGQQQKTISVMLNDTTVADALNKIARVYGTAVWVLVKNECNRSGRNTFSIKFIHN